MAPEPSFLHPWQFYESKHSLFSWGQEQRWIHGRQQHAVLLMYERARLSLNSLLERICFQVDGFRLRRCQRVLFPGLSSNFPTTSVYLATSLDPKPSSCPYRHPVSPSSPLRSRSGYYCTYLARTSSRWKRYGLLRCPVMQC